MRARLFLLLILLLVTTSFFWEDEEKQLCQLHQSGEAAFQKRDFEGAKKAFEELLGRISVVASHKYHVDWRTYVDIAMRLATAYDELQEKEEAEKVLSLLLAKNPPEEMVVQAKLMRARLSATRASPAKAYLEMRQLAKCVPIELWSNKERAFYQALEHSLDVYYDELVFKAKLHLMAALYPEAITLYEDILWAIENRCYPKIKDPEALLVKTIRYRLAECHYLATDYEKSLSYCSEEGKPDSVDREMLYLSALCYREKREYEKALELFQNYTHLGDAAELDHYDHALFEIGNYYYQRGQTAKARRYFERLHNFTRKPSQLAALLLARIYLQEKSPKEVERLLALLTSHLNPQDSLRYECYYIRGLAAYALKEYGEARDFFERSLPEQKMGKWLPHSLYHLGWCYVRLGDDPLKAEEVRRRFFSQAEAVFNRLCHSEQPEEAYLALAQLYVISSRHFNTREPLDKLESLLQARAGAFSLDGQLEALLLRAEAAAGYEEKDKLYAVATGDKFKRTPLYAQAWYGRGLNDFEAGLKDPNHPISLFEAAASAFEKAFRCSEKGDREMAADILKLEAKANMCRHSPTTSLALLEKLLSQFDESMEEREETLYLRGLLASQLTSLPYFPVAEESLLQVIATYPQGKYTENALYALAALYYENEHFAQAQTTFSQLAEAYPQSNRAPEAWFWAAEAASLAGADPAPMRRHVYEDYPDCEQAAEAYFRLYPYARYVEGGSEPLHHLRGFFSRFHDAPLEIVIHYLLGLHAEEWEEARATFGSALEAFAREEAANPRLDSAYIYFRYQTMLELAARALKEDPPLQQCEEVLMALIHDFSDRGHPLTSRLKQASGYPAQLEEGEFKLVQYYLKRGEDPQAQHRLQQMLVHFNDAGIQEGYYLSQVWLEQGRLAMRCGDYDTALNCFEVALTCGSPSVEEPKLTLWLLQSECYREKKEYDSAMRFLSKVINAETASPLRLKAMYYRSEIYELEGRPELAIRQLEATAKKGGEWAQQAKNKLRDTYGLQ